MTYLMENLEEAVRLEIKTDPEMVRNQAAGVVSNPASGCWMQDAGRVRSPQFSIRCSGPVAKFSALTVQEKRMDPPSERFFWIQDVLPTPP